MKYTSSSDVDIRWAFTSRVPAPHGRFNTGVITSWTGNRLFVFGDDEKRL